MNRLVLAAIAVPTLFAASPAWACGGPGVALIHRSLPDVLPGGVIVAEVELEQEIDLAEPRVRALVRRMIQGEAATILILPTSDVIAGCTSTFGNGSSGFIIGRARGYEGDALVVDPQHAPVRNNDDQPASGLRLPGANG